MSIDKDVLLQTLVPTIMVPKYGDLQQIATAYRFLMAEDGLWIEAKPAFGHFRMPLWTSPRFLPYGSLEPICLLHGGDIPEGLITDCLEEAKQQADKQKEWAGWITWDESTGKFKNFPLQILSDSLSFVSYTIPILPPGNHLVMDLHSHPFHLPTFSHIDNQDDVGGIHYSGVFSRKEDGSWKLSLRLCIEGFFMEVS